MTLTYVLAVRRRELGRRLRLALPSFAPAGVMLAASSHAEVQRSLRSLGVERAIGFTRGAVARRYALSAARTSAAQRRSDEAISSKRRISRTPSSTTARVPPLDCSVSPRKRLGSAM